MQQVKSQFTLSRKHKWQVAGVATAVFIFTALLSLAIEHHSQLERQQHVSQAAQQMARQLDQHLTECLSATYALAALIKSSHGDTSGFAGLAKEFISFQRGIAALQLAPNGIVQYIVPLQGNEKAIGHNLLTDKKRSVEAKLAIKTHRLTLAGPFELKQGGDVAVVGRLPVFLGENSDKFWGFTIALIKMPNFLQVAQLNELVQHGYSYELWRTHPDTGKRYVFAQSNTPLIGNVVTAFLDVPNGRWFLSLTPHTGWLNYRRLALEFSLSILSGFVAGWFTLSRLRALSALKMTECALYEAEEKYRTVADFAYDWETWIDQNGQYLYISPSCQRLTSYTASEFIADSSLMFRLVHSDDLHCVKKHFDQGHALNEQAGKIEFRIITKAGETRWIEHFCQPVIKENGIYLGRRASNRDVTERKQAEDRLRKIQESFTEAQRTAQIGNWELNLQDNTLFWSDEIFHIFEIDQQRFPATYEAFLAAIHPEDRMKVNNAYLTSLEKHEPYEIEHRLLMPDQRIKYVYEQCQTFYDATGKPIRSAGTVQDITKRVLAEQELEHYRRHLETLVQERTAALLVAKEKAEAASRAKSVFIATMSHEFRTPLNAILGFSQLIMQDKNTPQKQKDTLAIIHRNGLHLLNLINDVLDIANIETGHLELEIQAFDLHKLLHEMSDRFKIRADNKRLNFSLEISPDVPQYVKTDSDKLRQVLLNLLENALKFTVQGQIILRSHALSLPTFAKVMLEIEVEDSGTGIPTDKLNDLFKPFVQLARQDLGLEGTGLGLTMCKSLIELMGGEISVSSVQGVGSTFKIELPVSTANAADVVVQKDVKNTDFIYPEQIASTSSVELELTPEMLNSVSLELRQQLLKVATNLDMDETDAVLAQIQKIAPDVAEALQKLAQGFEFEKIIQLIEAVSAKDSD